ncbi:FkbM family methyltransferase [Labrys neptuniae]|uniref:FkbM family methyltransferase n=1 Tax=Labrys neptuniae TaxID=376174 RepID=UPI00288E70ED|nr:FkbM family methyltransferase [Labrys neptuniae]MDT3381991.1 FkbM family methyltransferase [Labrys neptuniae]
MTTPLVELLGPARRTHIVDIGANPIDGDPPYKSMLAAGLARLTGFEPQAEALARLEAAKGPNESYLPHAIGDGGEAYLNLCAYSGWSSLLTPRQDALEVFSYFKPNAQVIGRIPVRTTRLDDLTVLPEIDMLKIDVQGAELAVFRNAREKLRSAVAIQTEISFVALYENQPGFGEIDIELRAQGFVPHCFKAVKFSPMAPYARPESWTPATNQLLEADIVYVRDFVDPDAMSDEQLKHLCLIAQYLYGSIELCGRCIDLLQRRGALPPDTLARYTALLETARPSTAS